MEYIATELQGVFVIEPKVFNDERGYFFEAWKKEEFEKQLLKLGYQNIYACVAVPEVEDEYLTNNSLSYHQYLGFKECGRFENCGCKFNRWYHIVWLQKHAATKIPTDRPKKFKGL